MNRKESLRKIMEKKEFSMLPQKDVEKAFEKFERRQVSDTEKVRLTRDFLHKVFGAFGGRKLLSGSIQRGRDEEWVLRKHLSTRERKPFYRKIYGKILKDLNKKLSIVDLGAGVNGFSYALFGKLGYSVKYVAVEAMGQIVNLTNDYFKKEQHNAEAIHLSLFDLRKLKKIIKDQKKPRIVFLFKVIDALETVEKDYSKKLILEIALLVEKIVLSFPTESMIKRKKFDAKRNWIINFIKEKFQITGDFSFGGERYLVLEKRQTL